MSNQSNIFGRAYEYICIETLKNEINKFRKAVIEKSSTYEIAKECWKVINEESKDIFKESALAATYSIFDLEPMITEQGEDYLVLKMQKDQEGEIGDVRDIIIIRNAERWEIGLSIKHNHFAVKHSRLGPNLDFGERWYGIRCSDSYWNDIRPIFDYINSEKEKGLKWSELDDKEHDVYIPLLEAFISELKKAYNAHPELPTKLVEYLLGEFDFYKVISIDNKRLTQIETYNLRGTLNKPSRENKPKVIVPIAKLPTRIISLDFKLQSNNTIELYLDEGWQFSFRIHNASTLVENSLKFDIQIVGMPASIISIQSKWNNL
jgi:hypothetical protein